MSVVYAESDAVAFKSLPARECDAYGMYLPVALLLQVWHLRAYAPREVLGVPTFEQIAQLGSTFALSALVLFGAYKLASKLLDALNAKLETDAVTQAKTAEAMSKLAEAFTEHEHRDQDRHYELRTLLRDDDHRPSRYQTHD